MAVVKALARRLGHRRWFARIFRGMVPLDRLVSRLSHGRIIALGLVPSLLITTTGRKSGQPRQNPLLYIPDGDSFVVIGSNWGQVHHPAWALNLLVNPDATVTLRGVDIRVRATVATGAERDRLWRKLISEWPAYEVYVERAGGRDIHIFRLSPLSNLP